MSDFDLGAMMRQAQMLRQQLETMQQSLDREVVEGSAGSGLVKVRVSGTQRILGIELSANAMTEDREMLQDLITTAVNAALEKAKSLQQQRVGGLLPPGMGGLPGL